MFKKKVIILGAKGTLGQMLVEVFSDTCEVVAWDREEGDVTREDLRLKIEDLRPQVIINATGYNAVDNAESEGRELAYQLNAEAPKMLAQVAKELGAVFVNYSSDYVFDGNTNKPYTEEDKPNPTSVYGKTKYAGEINVREVGGKYYIIRPSRIFGEAGSSEASKMSFVDLMLNLAEKKDHLDIVDEEVGSPTYAPDLARLTHEIVEAEQPYGIYHGTNEGHCSWYEFAGEIFKLKNIEISTKPVPSSHFPRPVARPMFSALANTKLSKQRTWQEALAEYLQAGVDLSVITITMNDDGKVLRQIDSVKRGVDSLNFEQIISDNGSDSDFLAKIRQKYPEVKLIENGKNLGFGAANNKALEIARGEFILFLNPDMHVEDASLDKMVEWMRSHPEVGVASCKLVDENGKFNRDAGPRRFPKLFDQLMIMLKVPHVFPGVLNN